MIKRLGRALAFLLSLCSIIIGVIDINNSINAKSLVYTDGWTVIYLIMSRQPQAIMWAIDGNNALLHVPIALLLAMLSLALYSLLPLRPNTRFAPQF